MPPNRAQQLVHRGHVDAAALLIDPGLIGAQEASRRILAFWTPGSDLRRLPSGAWVLTLVPAGRLNAQTAPGTPLVNRAGRLVSVPLTEAGWSRLSPPPGALIFARAGALEVVEWSSTVAEDPSSAIDLSTLRAAEVVSLGESPAEPTLPPPPPADVREALGSRIPPASPEQRELLAALRAAKGPGATPPSPGPLGLLGRALLWLAHELTGTTAPSEGGGPRRAAPPTPPGWWQQLGKRLGRWAYAFTAWTGLSQLLGRRQARYLGKLLKLFEERDLTEALRHAIPLGGESSGSSPLLGVPGPREELRITPGGLSSSGGSLGLGPELFAHLQQTYRQAVQRLERRGELEQAAFVLAELLQASEEAVSFLERHGKLVEAARLAESRGLGPGLVVRQWFLAKDVARAIEVARIHNAYGDAVVRLQASHPEEAARLRLLWADSLAEAGHYAQAADVLWQVEGARGLCVAWIDRAIALGGPPGARALVRKLALHPEAFAEVRTAAVALLAESGEEGLAERLALASELMVPIAVQDSARFGAPNRTLGRAALRALIRDAGLYPDAGLRTEVERLNRHVGDGPLKADLPRLPGVTGSQRAPLPLRIRLSSAEAGAFSISDVARLPNGRVIAALGEAGVRLLAPDGRVLRHIDVPADRLVLAHHGARAIALARRGEVFRLSRIDLLSGAAKHWCDAELTQWADSFDGNLWFAANSQRIFAVDPLAEGLRALWQIPDVGRVTAMSRPEQRFSFVAGEEVWTLQPEGLTLRGRTPLEWPGKQSAAELTIVPSLPLAVDPVGTVAHAFIAVAEGRSHPALSIAGGPLLQFPGDQLSSESEGNLSAFRPSLVFVGHDVAFCTLGLEPRVRLLNPARQAQVCEIALEGATRAVLRSTPDGLLLTGDDRGRILMVDPRGGVPRQLRV